MTRHFTPAEDTLIREQSEGKHVLTRLMRTMHASREAITRRAFELDLKLCIRHRHRRSMRREEYARRDELLRRKIEERRDNALCLVDRGNPVRMEYHGHDDGLLEKLLKEHNNRRYDELTGSILWMPH